MWTHDVIENMEGYAKRAKRANLAHDVLAFVTAAGHLRKSETFHFGNAENHMKRLRGKTAGDVGFTRAPFPETFVEYEIVDEDGVRNKRAVLVIERDEDGVIFQDMVSFLFSKEDKDWMMLPCFAVLRNDRNGPAVETRQFLGAIEVNDGISVEAAAMAVFASSLMQFLNCRNICTERVVPPKKLNAKRSRTGREPMYSYRILKIGGYSCKVKHTDIEHEWTEKIQNVITAAHLCRGHYKTYTEDAPLFGKYVGTFWFSASVRGNPEHGIVEKDYEVEIPDEAPAPSMPM